MCFGPELLLALGGAAVSGVGSMISQNESASDAAARTRARNEELRATLARQKAFGERNAAVLSKTNERLEAPAQQKLLADAQQQRGDMLSGQVVQNDAAAIPLSGSAPSVVKSEVAKRMLSAMQDSTAKAKALGKLGGYGQQWFTNALGNTEAGRQIDTTNSFSRAEAAMLPGQQDLAEMAAARPSSGIGGILQGVGNLTGAAAGSGKVSGWFS